MEENNVTQFEKLNMAKPTMKNFDINLARQGHPVCTRDGRKARIACFDFKGLNNRNILALIENEDDIEDVVAFKSDGSFNIYPTDYDLMMAPVKHEGWVNVYRNNSGKIYTGEVVHESEERAKLIRNKPLNGDYITTVKIKWEE